LSNLELVVGVCSTLQRTGRCLLVASEVLYAGLANGTEVHFLGVTATREETGGIADSSRCLDQVTSVLVELELGGGGSRTNIANSTALTATNGDVLTITDSDIERSTQGRRGAGRGGGA
jgi:hypothetical protein